jgi:hypothetical protein
MDLPRRRLLARGLKAFITAIIPMAVALAQQDVAAARIQQQPHAADRRWLPADGRAAVTGDRYLIEQIARHN